MVRAAKPIDRPPEEIVHPGTCLHTILEMAMQSTGDFSEVSGIPVEILDRFVRQEIDVDAGLAQSLSKAMNTTIGFWTNLQAQWDEKCRTEPKPDEVIDAKGGDGEDASTIP